MTELRQSPTDILHQSDNDKVTPNPRPELSVVVPAYNEAENIGETVGNISMIAGSLCDYAEIIVVNDGSNDGTERELETIDDVRTNVEVYTLSDNRGKGFAVKTGCTQVNGEFVMVMDADGELDPIQIAGFLAIQERTNADVVIGSKRHPDSRVEYPLTRRFLSRGYSAFVRGLFGLRVTDTQVGMKLLSRKVVEEIVPKLRVNRYAFDVELLALAVHHGFTVEEAPVTLEFKLGSHVDIREIVRIALDTVAIFYRLRIAREYGRIVDSRESSGM